MNNMKELNDTLEQVVCRLTCGDEVKNEKATAFLISNNRAITARHAIEDYYEQDKPISLEFLNIDSQPISVKAIPCNLSEFESSPISILELEDEINIESYLEFSDYKIEKDDPYETFGYPAVKWNIGERTKSYVSRVINKKMTGFYDWNVDLKCDSNIEDFRGLSGSPLIVNGMLSGVILAESTVKGKAISLGAVNIEDLIPVLDHIGIPVNKDGRYYSLDEIYEMDDSSDYSNAVFVAKLESASIYDHEDCQEELFNADIAKSIIESQGIKSDVQKYKNLKMSLKSVWKTEHRTYKDGLDGNDLLKEVYKTVEQLSETTLKTDLPLSLIVKKGILHQLSDECKVGWVNNYKERLKKFLEEKEQTND